jgi:Family of unknown function (DUF6978)
MFTNAEYHEIMSLKKIISEKNFQLDLRNEKNRIKLLSEQGTEYEFLLDITSNQKITFKISLHHQEDISKIGLLRVDYKGRHKNPMELNEFVPEKFHPYLGLWIDEPHIHFYVDQYPPLVWAIPLSDYSFPVKNISNGREFGNAVRAMSKEINLVSKFTILESVI